MHDIPKQLNNFHMNFFMPITSTKFHYFKEFNTIPSSLRLEQTSDISKGPSHGMVLLSIINAGQKIKKIIMETYFINRPAEVIVANANSDKTADDGLREDGEVDEPLHLVAGQTDSLEVLFGGHSFGSVFGTAGSLVITAIIRPTKRFFFIYFFFEGLHFQEKEMSQNLGNSAASDNQK